MHTASWVSFFKSHPSWFLRQGLSLAREPNRCPCLHLSSTGIITMHHHAPPCSTILHHTLPYSSILHYTPPCATTTHHTPPCTTILYCAPSCINHMYHHVPPSMHHHACGLLRGCWGSNSGSHAYKASILPVELSPRLKICIAEGPGCLFSSIVQITVLPDSAILICLAWDLVYL